MNRPWVVLLLLLLSGTTPAEDGGGLTPLSESEMSTISGQQGVLLDLNLRNNVSASNTPIGCTAVVGSPNPCRYGLEFAARNGVWLMFKEYYGTLQLNGLRMDVGFLPATATGYQNTSRFQDGSGTCLVPACNPAGRPTLKFSYPGTDGPGVYNDFLSFLNIGRVWLEFDTAGPPVMPGYQRDTTLNSVFGIRMSDSSALNASTRMRFLGTSYVYGF